MTSRIKPNKAIRVVAASGTANITTAGGFANATLNFTKPTNGEWIGTLLETVGASNSVNNVTVCVPTSDSETTTVYRVVSSQVQTVTVSARKIYLV